MKFRSLVLLVLLGMAPVGCSLAAVLMTAPLEDGKEEVFHIKDEMARSLPTWSGGPDEPILSIGAASEIARQSLPTTMRHYQLSAVFLSRVYSRLGGEVWFYTFSYSNDEQVSPTIFTKRVVVLLNGETIEGESMTEPELNKLIRQYMLSDESLESDAD